MRLARDFQTAWPAASIPVDVTAYANWAGAYTTVGPARITFASLDPEGQGVQGLETLFHEALHTMDGAVTAALRRAGDAAGTPVPYDVTHAIIFHTAGRRTRELRPDLVPYAARVGLWARPPLALYRRLLEEVWEPYLDGRAELDATARRLVAGL